MSRQVKRISSLGATAKQLLKQTPSFVRWNGAYVKPVKLKIRVNNGIRHYSTVTRTVDENEGKPRKHIQSIYLMNQSKLSINNCRVHVSCDCDFFLYYCEVALFRIGSASIIYSNGKAPNVTNPRMIPFCCKHLYVVMKKLIQIGK